MADTKPHNEAEQWIREKYLPKKYGQSFRQKNLDVQSRGQFTFPQLSGLTRPPRLLDRQSSWRFGGGFDRNR